ncbi:hypothetical protein BRD00_09715 [Halobacteriales archaeon QS_8_69_26]|nr:MAG: hypothetical protein BRD00_09715 [Halobacteriales archaeon QS_8_69_26]
MREFAFEVSLCARLEADREAVVARQLGGGVRANRRVLDTVLVEPGPEFGERAAITAGTIPPAAIESDAGPGRFRPVAEAIDAPPGRARRIAERAAEAGFFELDRRSGRLYVRQVARYPDWFEEVVGVENKPDLGEPGDLATQLRKDVSLGLVDRAVLATESHVTGAHRNRIPDPVGIWRFDGEQVEVVREPTPLDTGGPGVEIVERHPGRAVVRIPTGEEKARARRRLAERAYGKGWRPDEVPACAHARNAERNGATGITGCEWKGRVVDPGEECGPACPGYEPASPPEADPDADRERRTPWVADPEGRKRRQAGLDRFG